MANKVWEELKEFYIKYFISDYFDYLFWFLLKYKLIRKSTSKKGYTDKYRELIKSTLEKLLDELFDYETIKTFTDSDDKTLNMDSGGFLAISKYNKILKDTFEELKTLSNDDVFQVVEALYEKR